VHPPAAVVGGEVDRILLGGAVGEGELEGDDLTNVEAGVAAGNLYLKPDVAGLLGKAGGLRLSSR
jgi:hypothetical protein